MTVKLASLLLLVVGLATCTSPLEPAKGDLLPVQEIYSQPSFSGIDTQTAAMITNATDWAAAWARIFSNYGPSQRPALPAVDFGSTVVLLAAAGETPTQLFAFQITEVRRNSDGLAVRVESVWPTCGGLPVVTSPVHIVSVPRVAMSAQFTFVNTSDDCS